jgi:hypothetical protein
MIRNLLRGAVAGAAGTTALNAATYLDMAVRARPASQTPQHAVEKVAAESGHPVPGDGEERGNRVEGLGSLAGIATGVGIGAAAGLLRPLLTRLPAVIGAVVLGGGAMAAADLPLVKLGLTDPSTWASADWLSDAIPHLAYGAVTFAALRATGPRTSRRNSGRRPARRRRLRDA